MMKKYDVYGRVILYCRTTVEASSEHDAMIIAARRTLDMNELDARNDVQWVGSPGNRYATPTIDEVKEST